MNGEYGTGRRLDSADARLNGPVAIGKGTGYLDRDLVKANRAGRQRGAIH